jgi:hypothetical protein
MDWSDERYVRVYTRDTPTMKLLRWEGRMVLFELLRKVDRAGVMDFGDEGPVEAISAVTDIPLEHVTVGLQRLLDRGCVVVKDGSIVVSKFLEAQESPQSDKHRQRESRAKRRDLARHGVTIRDMDDVTKRDTSVTKRDTPTEGASAPVVTKPVAAVTKPVASDGKTDETVTLYCTVPNCTVPNCTGTHTTAADRSARETGVVAPTPEPEPTKSKTEKTPCPVDLWEHMPEPTKRALDVALIPSAAQEYMCRGFAARYAGRPDQLRTLDQWVSSAVRAIQSDWNDPNKRPKQPAPSANGSAPRAPGPQDFSDPLSRRLLGRKIQ